MISLNRPPLDTAGIRDPVQALLPSGAQIEMILKQRAQQLPPNAQQLSLNFPMLEAGRAIAAQPANDLLKPLTRATERILNALAREIACRMLRPTLGLQDFISRRVKFATADAGVGDHVARLPGSTLV